MSWSWLAEKAAVCVQLDDVERFFKPTGCRGWLVRLPLSCLAHPVDVPELTGFDVAELGKRSASRLAWLPSPKRPYLENRHRLTIDLIVVVNLIFEFGWDLVQAPLANGQVNVPEVFYAECHDRER